MCTFVKCALQKEADELKKEKNIIREINFKNKTL